MDDRRFNGLARALGAMGGRRDLLRAMVGAAWLGLAVPGDDSDGATARNKHYRGRRSDRDAAPFAAEKKRKKKKEAVQTHVPGQGLRLQRLPRRDMRDLLGHHPLHRGRAMCRLVSAAVIARPWPATPSPATKRGRASTHPSGTVRSAARRTISVAAGSASTRPMTKPIAAPYAAAARRAATVCAARCARAATVPTVRFRRRSTRRPPGPRSTSAPARTSAARQ